jgi:hypothetical protein
VYFMGFLVNNCIDFITRADSFYCVTRETSSCLPSTPTRLTRLRVDHMIEIGHFASTFEPILVFLTEAMIYMFSYL